jgi:ribonuclease HI
MSAILKILAIYTDGSCADGIGGWGIIGVRGGRKVFEQSGGEHGTTNNRMELMAILRAHIQALHLSDNVIIKTDSQVSINGILHASPDRLANADLINQIRSIRKQLPKPVALLWVKGHAGEYWNEHVDKLAAAARQAISP